MLQHDELSNIILSERKHMSGSIYIEYRIDINLQRLSRFVVSKSWGVLWGNWGVTANGLWVSLAVMKMI